MRIIIIMLIIVSILILNCQGPHSSSKIENSDSMKFQIVNCKFVSKDKEDKRLYKIFVNDSIVFDSLLISVHKYSALNIIDCKDFYFINHCLDGVYYNFMGLIDKNKGKWIIYQKDTSEIPKYMRVMLNVRFNGLSPNKRFFLFSGGSSGGTTTYEIYNWQGELVYKFANLNVGKEEKWNNESNFEYWDYAKVDKDTMPKLKDFYSWIQKYIWTEKGVIKVDSIFQAYAE